MADRNDHRSSWSGGGEDRWRERDERRARETRSPGREDRSFRDEGRYGSPRGGHGEGEGEPWRRDRYGSRYDQDRTNYGSGWDRDRGDYGRGQYDRGGDRSFDREHRNAGQREDWNRGEDMGYRSRSGGRQDYRQAWRPAGGAPYGDLELNAGGRGYEEYGAPHDYAYHPDHDFEPDYLHWRDEQLRLHDRDYQEWRRDQHRQYDEEYRQFKAERRSTFGQNFHQWRSQRNMSTGMPQQHIGGDIGDYHRRTATGFGRGGDQPSGSLEPPAGMTPSPSLSQSAPAGTGEGGSGAGSSAGPEFGKEPSRVQAVSDGSDGRKDAEDREDDRKGEDRKH